MVTLTLDDLSDFYFTPNQATGNRRRKEGLNWVGAFTANGYAGLFESRFNANPGLKVNRSMYISCIETFFTAYVLCSLRLSKFKTEGQKISTENLTAKLQN